MNCPRCKSPIGPLESPDAIVTCPGCGTRLMTRSAALRSQGSTQGQAPDPPPPAAPVQQTAVKVGVRQTTISGKTAGAAVRSGSRKAQAAAPAPSGVTLDMILAEIQAVRDTQQLVLEALGGLRRGQAQAPLTGATADGVEETGGTTLSPIRTASHKSVVVVDDDDETRQAVVAELERAGIPVRAFTDGNKALGAIAEDKPDVIVLELAVGGDLGGKDLVNMIKATMEWVDIPIVLWTREAISNQKEARQIHGADEVVSKSQGAAALVARVITVFRR
ncbi:MAG TPA: response regulator [Vicinamibacteria bacterium]|nr:response regulator [Vicinamibacteria bacterium]